MGRGSAHTLPLTHGQLQTQTEERDLTLQVDATPGRELSSSLGSSFASEKPPRLEFPYFLHNCRPSVPHFSLKSLPLRQPPVADGFATAFAILFYSPVNPSVAGNITGIFIFQVYPSKGPTHPIFPLFPHVSCFPQKLWHHQEGLSPCGSLYNIFVQLGKRCPFFRILHFTLAEKHYNGLILHLENCQDKYTNLQYRCHE